MLVGALRCCATSARLAPRLQVAGAPLCMRALSAKAPGTEKPPRLPDVAHFATRRPSKDSSLDLSHLFTHPAWAKEEREQVKKIHHEPQGLVEKAAYRSVQMLRLGFDLGSGYLWKSRFHSMNEGDWTRRIIFLETVAGVPGMMAAMVRHMHSLRLMRRDHGWIHALLSEAENERMHLLIALRLRKPGIVFRSAVIVTQAVFVMWYTLAYLICPRYCHRFVGYLEEEAVKTYTHLIEEIDSGNLPLFAQMPAPRFAGVYYHLPRDATLRDVFECIRADESHHRDANHHFAGLKPDEPNHLVEHLRRPHGSS